MKKILVVVGTRPNFMKVTRFKEVAATYPGLNVEFVHTGQHTATEMTTVFFEQFGMRPDHLLEIPDGTYSSRTTQMIQGLEAMFRSIRPQLLVVVGDVDGTLAGARAAERCEIPLVHVESGLRSGDLTMPEEVNRILVDRISDHFMVTEASGRENLLHEGMDDDRIHMVGNTMIDTLVAFDEQIKGSPIMEELGLDDGGHILVTMHRPATVDDPEALGRLVDTLQWLGGDRRIVYPVHPRTRSNLERFGLWEKLRSTDNVLLTDPLDYFAFQRILATSLLVLTDSGGIQEETTFRQVPCLTLRPNTERPVTISQGTNQLVTFDREMLQNAVDRIKAGNGSRGGIPDLWDGHATERVFEVLNRIV